MSFFPVSFFPASLVLMSLFGSACGPKIDKDAAVAAVQAAFAEANPPGRTGLEIVGKGIWYEADMFDKSCLEQNDLAFNDDPSSRPKNGVARISPTYAAQVGVTASTERGFCLDLGVDPTLTVDEVTWGGDRYRVHATITMAQPSKWFTCLESSVRSRMIEVTVDEAGAPVLSQALSLYQGGCPHPLPEAQPRKGSAARPKNPAPKAPTRAEVEALLTRLDDAFYGGNFQEVLDLTACYNLFEDPPYGACAVSEVIALGPSFHGDPRPRDGAVWAEYALKSADGFGRIEKDRADPSTYNVLVTHSRTKRVRSLALQWVGGEWKLVGVVGLKSEGITSVRYLYDLHSSERRDIFDRRLAGEKIDEQGLSTVPEHLQEQE